MDRWMDLWIIHQQNQKALIILLWWKKCVWLKTCVWWLMAKWGVCCINSWEDAEDCTPLKASSRAPTPTHVHKHQHKSTWHANQALSTKQLHRQHVYKIKNIYIQGISAITYNSINDYDVTEIIRPLLYVLKMLLKIWD